MWVVAQVGARDGYIAARVLKRRNLLHRLVTDFWTDGPLGPVMRRASGRSERRFTSDLDPGDVKSFNLSSGLDRVGHRLAPRGATAFERWIREGERFGEKAARYVSKGNVDAVTGVWGYTCANREILALATGFADGGRFTARLIQDPCTTRSSRRSGAAFLPPLGGRKCPPTPSFEEFGRSGSLRM